MLGLLPKALEQYQDPIAVAKASELALITYTALLDAVEKSDAHAVISELPQEKKTGHLKNLTRTWWNVSQMQQASHKQARNKILSHFYRIIY